MEQNAKQKRRSGFTLVEVLIAIVLVSVAAAVVYTEMISSFRILMRSRAKLDAQGLAFDSLWEVYNLAQDKLPEASTPNFIPDSVPESRRLSYGWQVPESSSLYPHGVINCRILAETNAPTLPDPTYYWDILMQVYAGEDSPVDFGERALVRYQVRRYAGER